MNEIFYSRRFSKQIKKFKNKKELNLIYQSINKLKFIELQDNGALPECHKLQGNKKDLWDYHIKGDLILLFEFDSENKRIDLFGIGNHYNVFD